ncbi:hypothetical protein [Streptomyces sp. NPDC054874]
MRTQWPGNLNAGQGIPQTDASVGAGRDEQWTARAPGECHHRRHGVLVRTQWPGNLGPGQGIPESDQPVLAASCEQCSTLGSGERHHSPNSAFDGQSFSNLGSLDRIYYQNAVSAACSEVRAAVRSSNHCETCKYCPGIRHHVVWRLPTGESGADGHSLAELYTPCGEREFEADLTRPLVRTVQEWLDLSPSRHSMLVWPRGDWQSEAAPEPAVSVPRKECRRKSCIVQDVAEICVLG